MPQRLSNPEVICILAAGAGATAEIIGILRGNPTLQRLGLAIITLGIFPIVSKVAAYTSNVRHFRRLKDEFDAYCKAQTEAMLREVEQREADIEGAAFARAIALCRSGELNEMGDPSMATVTTLHPPRDGQGDNSNKIRA